MKKIIFILFLITVTTMNAQQTDPVSVVQEQLEAYNAHDLERFLAVFHEDVELYTLGNNKPIAVGKEQVRNLYANLFTASPELLSVVINRTQIGNKVIDYERITGRQGSTTPVDLVMIYEVKEGKIIKAFSIR